MLACKVIRQAVARRDGCAFVIAEEWLRSLYGLSGYEQRTAIERLSKVRVCVFDEVGFEPTTEFSSRALYEVINSRMLDNRNGLVVTSNLSLEQLASRLQDDRLTSRLGGLCGANVIELMERDRRQPD
jgi:DNA replication protein DnaC